MEKQDPHTKLFMGRSTQNKQVYFLGESTDIGKILAIKINKANAITFYGDKVS